MQKSKIKNKNYRDGPKVPSRCEGQAALVAVMFFLAISTAISGSVAYFTSIELKSSASAVKSKQSISFTEGASEDAAYRIAAGKNVPAQFSYSEGTLHATNTISVLDEYTKDILTQGAQTNVRRKNHVLMEKVYKASFLFGGLVGEGGIHMQNTSSIIGNIHTNGSVTGQNFPKIIGNASAVGTISNPPTVSGTRAEGTSPQPMPIPEQVLDGWETEAENGGVYDGQCPYKPPDGATIGFLKIPCDMEIDGTKTVTLTGKIWIAGNLDIKNSATLKLAPSYGNKSEVVVVHDPDDEEEKGKISVQNSAQILGSGTDGSYIMMVSRNNAAESGEDETAIDIKNSSSASIYYAPHGKVVVQNASQDVHLKTVTAYRLELKNSASIEYESELAEVKIPYDQWVVTSWGEKP